MSTPVNIDYKKSPKAISQNLSLIVSEYNSFKSNLGLASDHLKSMDKVWFGPERDGFVTTWNKNLDVSNTYLKNMCTASKNLNATFKLISTTLGFKVPDITVKLLSLQKFSSKNATTGKVNSSELLNILSSYKSEMKDAITNLKNLTEKTTQASIGIHDNANGRIGQDIKTFHDVVNHVYTQINQLNKNTIKFVDQSISNISKANS